MARTHYIAGNWKMNTSRAEAVKLAQDLVAVLKDKKGKYMIGVPFVYLDAVSQVIKGSNIILGAQDVAATANGAHTGEVSTEMLKDVGVKTVIIGHSERRHEIGESDELINKKVRRCLSEGLDVVLCIGELLADREAGNAETVCAFQLSANLAGVSAEQMLMLQSLTNLFGQSEQERLQLLKMQKLSISSAVNILQNFTTRKLPMRQSSSTAVQ